MNFDVPPWLRAAIETEVGGLSGRMLAKARIETTERYRAGRTSAAAIRFEAESGAYLAARMPATYAAISAALHQALLSAPDFNPRSLLDIGAGPGTASLAACEALPDIEAVTLLDSNAAFLEAARHLLAASPSPVLQSARIEAADMRAATDERADLVIAGYSMIELAPSAIPAFIDRLWQATTGMLLLVEPGTPAGYANILVARAVSIAAGAHVVAPCPHQGPCPLIAPDWCHFSQRLARSRLHRQVKGADAPFEDERFSYLAIARQAPASRLPRILAPPIESKAGIALKLCTDVGLALRTISSRDKPAFKQARKLGWGDVLEA